MTTLFDRACRVSCTVNGKDPDELIANPYGERPADPCDYDAMKPRWWWVREICGKEIQAILALAKAEENA